MRIGQCAERLWEYWLSKHGHRIYKRNLRCPGGEVDLISQKHSVLYVWEVKFRSGTLACKEEVIDYRKFKRIKRCVASRFIIDKRLSHLSVVYFGVIFTFEYWKQIGIQLVRLG